MEVEQEAVAHGLAYHRDGKDRASVQFGSPRIKATANFTDGFIGDLHGEVIRAVGYLPIQRPCG
ncbi:Uncharacterised protein [Mycobacterium tuberculosis]|uniref:Uncharacterized protein n=1 Tax=Mycobacterium tuberculosis TaxID=1773 RepID=A0A655CBV1_MYCTX|nr:Uncharacterised protein [Mycobacterium tuberculosis]CKQ04554.1 Uncharacterised protein [Mycobacterium tuberculosis]CKR78040.1 Uncharacterised protein [Mycobacterium tuberculosis]CKS27550.1 Uncharacterised protein [Mycobacterium tuberculosis]CNU05002.1 Uncharacterised protein [Mycobacterium tuberculosis]